MSICKKFKRIWTTLLKKFKLINESTKVKLIGDETDANIFGVNRRSTHWRSRNTGITGLFDLAASLQAKHEFRLIFELFWLNLNLKPFMYS